MAVTNIVLDEKVALAYDIPPTSKGPVTFLLLDGKSYYLNNDRYLVNETSHWINSKAYTNSPYQFKVPASLNDNF